MLPVLVAWGSAVLADEAGVQLFEEKIRPVLVKHCYKCHSAQALRANKLKGGLLLDSRAGIRKGGESGSAVVPGNLQRSLIVEALRYESLEMPPEGKLPDALVADFVTWIKMGAPDPRDDQQEIGTSGPSSDMEQALQFWAFQPPRESETPETLDTSWPQSDIDRFVLAKLEASGMHASSPVDSGRSYAARPLTSLVYLRLRWR